MPSWDDGHPWFRHNHIWSDFVLRAQYLNSSGHTAPTVLVLNPMESAWALSNLNKVDKTIHYTFRNSPEFVDRKVNAIDAQYTDIMNQLVAHRVEFLISDTFYFDQMKLEGGKLVRGPHRFKTVVMPPMTMMSTAMASKLAAFAKAGGHVYGTGELPADSPEHGKNCMELAAHMAALRDQPTFNADCKLAAKLAAGSPGLEPMLQFVSGSFDMLAQHRVIDGRHFFWLVNNHNVSKEFVLRIPEVAGGASIFDCETGVVTEIRSTPSGGGSEVPLALGEYEAYWLVIDPGKAFHTDSKAKKLHEFVYSPVEGSWTAAIDMKKQTVLENATKTPDALTQAEGATVDLADWQQWGVFDNRFSGTVDYITTIHVSDPAAAAVLDLGEVHHVAEVFVNEEPVGVRLWSPFTFDISERIKRGDNRVRVSVGNGLSNNYGQGGKSGMYGPVRIGRKVGAGAIIVDDGATGFATAGTWELHSTQGYGGDVQAVHAGNGAKSATWTPNLPKPGKYRVYARWSAHPNRATNTPLTVSFEGGNETVRVDQQTNGDQWNLLGTWTFFAGESGHVKMTDQANGYVIADAVMFEPL
jgi:hypothetical protein